MSFMRGRPVVVWGARGLIGRALVDSLLASELDVRVLTRDATDPLPWSQQRVTVWGIEPERAAAAFEAALDGAGVIFNLAGASGAVASNRDPIASLDANCRAQLQFLTAVERQAQRPQVVFASSRLVYAPAGRAAVSETHPVEPLSIYGAHKLTVEHYHRVFAARGVLSFTICRISNPYGIDDSSLVKGYGFVNALIQRALADDALTLFGDGDQLRDYLHIDDLVQRLCAAATVAEARNQVINVGCGTSISMRDAATHICQVFGGGRIELRPWPADYATVESGDFVMDTVRAERLLGCGQAVSFSDGLKRIRQRLNQPYGAR